MLGGTSHLCIWDSEAVWQTGPQAINPVLCTGANKMITNVRVRPQGPLGAQVAHRGLTVAQEALVALSDRLGGSEYVELPLHMWEFPKIGGSLSWGPYNKDPTI